VPVDLIAGTRWLSPTNHGLVSCSFDEQNRPTGKGITAENDEDDDIARIAQFRHECALIQGQWAETGDTPTAAPSPESAAESGDGLAADQSLDDSAAVARVVGLVVAGLAHDHPGVGMSYR